MSKPKIAFICVHNSCRSQIAEAFGKVLAADVFESYSAGTEIKPQINQDAVRLMNPTGKSDDEFKAVIEQIRQNVLALKSKLCGSSF